MKNKIKCFSVVIFLTLTSCSYFATDRYKFIQNRDTDYLQAGSIAPLRVPPCLSSSTITPHYPIPERYYPEAMKRVDLSPPELHTYICSSPQDMGASPVAGWPTPVRSASTVKSSATPTVASPVNYSGNRQVNQVNPSINSTKPMQQAKRSDFYYDRYTRGKMGGASPVALANGLPWNLKQNHSSTQVNTSYQEKKQATVANQQKTQEKTSYNPIINTAEQNPKPKALAQNQSHNETQNQQTQNDSGNEEQQNSKLPNIYTDRYSHR